MTGRDLMGIAAGNLWRMKLRTFLTVSGVLVAIGAFVTMLSFGAGNRRLVMEQFSELGLFTTLQVFPAENAGDDEGESGPILDEAAMAELAGLPGVRLAYPFDTFRVHVAVADTAFSTEAQALPVAALDTKRFSSLAAGEHWRGNGEGEVLVSTDLLEMLSLEEPDSLVGKTVTVSVNVASVDSGLARVLASETRSPMEIFASVRLDSIRNSEYQRRLLQREMAPALARFIEGYLAGGTVSDTLRICGVIEGRRRGRLRMEPILLPDHSAARFSEAGPSSDPAALFATMRDGRFTLFGETPADEGYPKVTLDLEPLASHTALGDSVEARGFRYFSFAEELEQIRRMFFYFDLMLGAIGFVAIVIAALGIVNTMVMSVSERRKEIGILKSLGADLRDIRILFLAESGLIGALGAVLGILLGWTVSRVASLIARSVMEREGLDVLDLFATPLWLVLTALLFGIVVSILAGSLPAARAAKVDPVAALRNE